MALDSAIVGRRVDARTAGEGDDRPCHRRISETRTRTGRMAKATPETL